MATRMNWAEWTLWKLIMLIGSIFIAYYDITYPFLVGEADSIKLVNLGITMALFWVVTWVLSRSIFTIGGRIKK